MSKNLIFVRENEFRGWESETAFQGANQCYYSSSNSFNHQTHRIIFPLFSLMYIVSKKRNSCHQNFFAQFSCFTESCVFCWSLRSIQTSRKVLSYLTFHIKKTWGFPSQFIQINQGDNGHTTRASPGVPRTRAGLELGTSRFTTRCINNCATRLGPHIFSSF